MGSWKLEKDVPLAELPRFLRELAQALESGQAHGDLRGLPSLDPAVGLRKLVLVAECREGGLRFKLKAKREGELLLGAKKSAEAVEPVGTFRPEPAAPRAAGAGRKPGAAGQGRDKYRQLKKTLQADYKALARAAEAGKLPAQELVESFIGLCEAMAGMEQPAGGPEAAELARASRSCLEDAKALRGLRDQGQLAEVLARLERRRSACHAQFK